MNKILTALLLTTLFCSSSIAQSFIDHWETAVYDTLNWKYFAGNSDPGSAWKNTDFNDALWSSGKGGVGFGDNDDKTTIGITTSVFLRYKFQVTDKAKLVEAFLHMDYDDGFVAYLNGTEIARSNMSQTSPAYYDLSQAPHEALMYTGENPEGYPIKESTLSSLIVNGDNVLAIQVHNFLASSDDLTARAFLSIGIKDISSFYGPTPSWFTIPQTFESSNLPVVIINTDSEVIVDGSEVEVEMGIIANGEGNRNNVTDPFNNYDGNVKIRIEETSQKFPKKTYTFKTVTDQGLDTAVSLMGVLPGDEWMLYAPYSDKSLMRDALTHKIAREMGHYSSRSKFCEVIVNNDYKGVYVLLEKIKIDTNRVDIKKLTPTDTSSSSITGGYIIKVDKANPNGFPGWESTPDPKLPDEATINFQFHNPEGELLTDEQKKYIQDYILAFESALSDKNYKDYMQGFRKYIDVPSFIDYMLIQEVNKSVEAYVSNTYMYKNVDSLGGKLKMGPLWSSNQAFGNVDYNETAQLAPGWIYNDTDRMYWFRRMMADEDFKNQFQCRFLDLRLTTLSSNSIAQWIDSTATVLAESQQRNFRRWPILGTYIWPNQYYGQTYKQDVNFLKDWIIDRLDWMDQNLENRCNPTGIEDDREEKAIVFPNPSSTGEFTFKFEVPVRNATLNIYSSTGSLLFNTSISGSTYRWDGLLDNGSKLQAGMYLFKIIKTNKKEIKGKIIKY